MVSFDVESLFTNVPVNNVIRLTHNLLLSDESLEDRTPIPPTEIIKLLEYCLKTFSSETTYTNRGLRHGISDMSDQGQPLHVYERSRTESPRLLHSHLDFGKDTSTTSSLLSRVAILRIFWDISIHRNRE